MDKEMRDITGSRNVWPGNDITSVCSKE